MIPTKLDRSIIYLKGFPKNKYHHFLVLKPLEPFSDIMMDYLSTLSKAIFKNKVSREYPDLIAFAFFCRKANLLLLKSKHHNNAQSTIGRGFIFHITPSNVPMNFAFSLCAGLLAGNHNLIKLPTKDYNQVNLLIKTINLLSKDLSFEEASNRIALVKYDKNNENITSRFSKDCDIRVIWGGDQSINSIRKSKLSPKTLEITFPDRYSFSIFNAESFLNDKNHVSLLNNFYNDTYLTDQNACTSPHLIIWHGDMEKIKSAKTIFWSKFHKIVKKNYQISTLSIMDKFTTFCEKAVDSSDIYLIKSPDNLIWRVDVSILNEDTENHRSNSGYFLEYNASSLEEMSGFITKKYQTMSYYGFKKNQLKKIIKTIRPNGLDRVVPVGRTMDFSLFWDGIDLIKSFSRVIEIV